MVTKEVFHHHFFAPELFARDTQSHEHSLAEFLPLPDFSDLWIGMLDIFEKYLRQPLREKLSKEITSKNSSFNATNLLRRLSVSAEKKYSLDQLLKLLPDDFRFFFDEFGLGLIEKKYWDSDQNKAKSAQKRPDQYQEDIAQMATKFVEIMEKAKKLQQRAEIESYNWQRIQAWKDAIRDPKYPVGSCLVVCSPAGGIIEGYPGISKKNHTLAFILKKEYNKAGQIDVSMTQVRCWPSLTQLENIQRNLKAKEQPSGILIEYKLPQKLTRRNKIIANIIETDPSMSTQEIIDAIFETEESWPQKRTDFPQLDNKEIDRLNRYRDVMVHAYLRDVYHEQITRYQQQLTLPYTHPFWTSDEYKAIVQARKNGGEKLLWLPYSSASEERVKKTM